jgi:DnaJ-class molecular chaperone
VEVQRAYGYLTNPLTRVIYDTHGVPGLECFEKHKKDFQELLEEIRDLEA